MLVFSVVSVFWVIALQLFYQNTLTTENTNIALQLFYQNTLTTENTNIALQLFYQNTLTTENTNIALQLFSQNTLTFCKAMLVFSVMSVCSDRITVKQC
jgi:hypothetical protein